MKLQKGILICCLIFVVFFFAATGGLIGQGQIQLVGALPFGWIGFLKRVLPAIAMNWSVIGMFILCLALILGGVHYFCSWVFASAQKAKAETITRRWSWRWTGSVVSAVCLLFFVGMAVIGIVHQTGWLVTSNDPLWVQRPRMDYFLMMKQQNLAFYTAMLDVETNQTVSFSTLRKSVREYGDPKISVKLQTLIIVNENGYPTGFIAVARDPEIRQKVQFVVSTSGRDDFFPISKLPEMLDKYAGRLKSL